MFDHILSNESNSYNVVYLIGFCYFGLVNYIHSVNVEHLSKPHPFLFTQYHLQSNRERKVN